MAEIATIFLSPFLQAFFEKMASGDFVEFFRHRKLSEGLLKKLETSFMTFVAVLEDAEEVQVTKPVVKKWLDELKDAVYDAEHVLDEIATQALRSELDAQFQTTASKARVPGDTRLQGVIESSGILCFGGKCRGVEVGTRCYLRRPIRLFVDHCMCAYFYVGCRRTFSVIS
ncbi:putative disease resistance RPP13-like protein 1 [Corylus avellana]|uniref:putative disease resistance RPP13-like protein 1 n=1 Tax=Corylus avellana TaxID=13451 RepID=UPI00286AF4E4|nr:putative disease resistance RPP13-like protein 1 [Corylus avellana]